MATSPRGITSPQAYFYPGCLRPRLQLLRLIRLFSGFRHSIESMRFEKVSRAFAADIALRRSGNRQYRRIPACIRQVTQFYQRRRLPHGLIRLLYA